jgi:uncharacterized protein (DUF1778 family)
MRAEEEDGLVEPAVIRMTPDAFEAFVDAISGPGTPVPQMVELFRRKAPWDSSPHQA